MDGKDDKNKVYTNNVQKTLMKYQFHNITLFVMIAISICVWLIMFEAIGSTFTKDSNSNRPYSSKVMFWMLPFTNEHGKWFGGFVATHGLPGMLFPLFFWIPLFATKKGSKAHMYSGLFIIFLWYILLIFGVFVRWFNMGIRGFNPCQYVSSDSGTAHSFSVFVYIHFIYWTCWIAESLAFAIIYGVMGETSNQMLWWQTRLLKYLCYNSIITNFIRILIFLFYLGYYGGNGKNVGCTSYSGFIIWFLVHIIELPFIITSIWNIEYLNGKQKNTFWYHIHGRNMFITVIQELWTFVTVIGLLINHASLLTAISYLIFPTIAILYFVYYKKWHVVALNKMGFHINENNEALNDTTQSELQPIPPSQSPNNSKPYVE